MRTSEIHFAARAFPDVVAQPGAVVLILAGLLVVLGSVLAGYLLERGNVFVLLQPAELLIIAGGALGIILVANPRRNLRALVHAIASIRRHRTHTREVYLAVLRMLYVLFQFSRRAGLPGLEPHVEAPHKSEIFRPCRVVLADDAVIAFICDSFRIAIAAGLDSQEMERLMSLDMEVQRAERQQPVRALVTVADSLPGLGIIAAVLGVVVTMRALGGPAADIGQKVAAALVGTFLGILLCYGVVGPLASHLECLNRARAEYLQVIRVAIVSFFHGVSPKVAAEAARRSIPLDVRPTFEEMEQWLRKAKIPAVRPQQRSDEAEPIALSES
jgi:chemotaxis protein MotA